MTKHESEALCFAQGGERPLPGTLAGTRSLTLTLLETDPTTGTAVFQLHNPQAQPDDLVAALVEEHADDVEKSNHLRDRLHLPEHPVPVDTSTVASEVLHVRLHEKLQLGDRVWTVSAMSDGQVTLVPGHDYESRSLVNEVLDEEYTPEATALAEKLNTVDKAL